MRPRSLIPKSACHVTAAEGNIIHFHNVNTGHSRGGPAGSFTSSPAGMGAGWLSLSMACAALGR
jgi:hypothetical protein